MINVGEEIKKKLQYDMVKSLIKTDTQIIDKKHSGKFISNLTYDVTHITNLLSNAILTLFKDSLNFNWFINCNVFSKLEIIFNFNNNDTSSKYFSKNFGKRMGKVATEAQEKSGFLTTYLVELFKNHKLIKFFKKKIMKKIEQINI